MDNDGDLDLILPEDKHSGNLELPANLYWFENPFIPGGDATRAWKKHVIDTDMKISAAKNTIATAQIIFGRL